MSRLSIGVVALALVAQAGCKKTKGDKLVTIVSNATHDMCGCELAECGAQVQEALIDALYQEFAGDVQGKEAQDALADSLRRVVGRDLDAGAEKEMNDQLLQILPGNLDTVGLVGELKRLIICSQGLKSNHP